MPVHLRHCFLLLLLASGALRAQSVQPFVDHWDSTRTVKRSEGLFVNGREWGLWRFWDPQGRLFEEAEFKGGERDGHVRLFYDNAQVQHDGWFRRGEQDSLMQSYYRSGTLMERGPYHRGRNRASGSTGTPTAVPTCVNSAPTPSACCSMPGTRPASAP